MISNTIDGYSFRNESDYKSYMYDRSECTWGPGPNPSNYGGYKEDEPTHEIYERDTCEVHNTHFQRSPKDPKYYHGPREEFDVMHETEKAYLLSNDVASFWCPKSLIIDVIRVRNSIAGRIWKGLNRQIIT